MKRISLLAGIVLLALASGACMADFSEDVSYFEDAVLETFHDDSFRQYCLEHFDVTGPEGVPDGFLSESECRAVKSMDCSGLGIYDLSGIQMFTSLDSLDCSDNFIEYLPLESQKNLKYLDCSNNLLPELSLFQTDVSILYCCPMLDSNGRNTLKYLYIRRGQEIEHVTSERLNADPKRIPDETEIIAIPETKK